MLISASDLHQHDLRSVTTGKKLPLVHPGEILLTEFLEPMNIARYSLAKAIGVSQTRVNEICAGDRSISAETAVRLGHAFDVEPQFWLNLQMQYDLEKILRERGKEISETVVHLHDEDDEHEAV